jgi:hypothetical protein
MPVASVPRVKGSTLTSRVAWVRERHGEMGLHRLRAAVLPETHALLEASLLKSAWYPFVAFVDLNLAIDREFGAGDLSLIKGLGRYGADVNLTTIYRLFYLVGSVEWIIERAPALFHVNYDAGRLAVELLGSNRAQLSILDFPLPHRAHCLSVLGWAERSLELSGVALLESVEIACRTRGDNACRFRLGWR